MTLKHSEGGGGLGHFISQICLLIISCSVLYLAVCLEMYKYKF